MQNDNRDSGIFELKARQQSSSEIFLRILQSGRIARGCCITLADPTITEIAAEAGMDFCWLDGEHGIIDRETMNLHIMALRRSNCVPLIRVPDSSHTEIKKVIDLAPAGIIIPMITNYEEAERAVAACRYPPMGNRGCGFRRGYRYGADSVREYLKRSDAEPLVILQIEHIDAVGALERILGIPGIDSILIGPYDLSASMGKIGQLDDSELNHVIDEICRKTLACGKWLGAYSEQDIRIWKKRGVHYLSVINDTQILFRGFCCKSGMQSDC